MTILLSLMGPPRVRQATPCELYDLKINPGEQYLSRKSSTRPEERSPNIGRTLRGKAPDILDIGRLISNMRCFGGLRSMQDCEHHHSCWANGWTKIVTLISGALLAPAFFPRLGGS